MKFAEKMQAFFLGMGCAFTITGDIPVRFSKENPLCRDTPQPPEELDIEKLQEEYWQLTIARLNIDNKTNDTNTETI